ncbi:MAG: DUF6412 domain-containing protein [Jatrophihabitantaceae bacterium]
MARNTSRWVIGALMLAALLASVPGALSVLGPDATSLAYLAALALVAALAVAATLATVPVPGLTRLAHTRDRAPAVLTRQSDPSAAGHSRPRAPDHR